MKPIFRWCGGKTRLLTKIKAYLPAQPRAYYEPFMGGGALFFDYGHFAFTSYVNDICSPLMEAYRQLRVNFSSVMALLVLMEERSYLSIRAEFNEQKAAGWPDRVNQAALFIALNHLCFNGVWRENKKGCFNTPVGKSGKGLERTLDTLDRAALGAGAIALDKACITSMDFRESYPRLVTPGLGDVVFYDPPYLGQYSSYGKDGFTQQDHRDLMDQTQEAARVGAKVIVCGSNNQLSWAIYGKPTEVIDLQRTVGHSLRDKATEALYVYG